VYAGNPGKVAGALANSVALGPAPLLLTALNTPTMSDCERQPCCAPPPVSTSTSSRFRRALWIALVVNVGMFIVELTFSFRAESVALLADAIDFLGDAANYAVSLLVLGLAVVWRSRAALLKGLAMGTYGAAVLGKTAWAAAHGTLPDAATMGAIGALALVANVGVTVLLYAFRQGDANMRSVWLCSRNDAISNVAVILAAAGVFGTASGWPDFLVALIMCVLALTSAWSVVRQALGELAQPLQAR
jgi:Co/Zn/Cd efflux system component